jgi:hypothetical protein
MAEPIREGFVDDKAVVALRPAEPLPPPEPVPSEPEDTWPMVVKLKHGAIRVDQHHPEITELNLRQPTAGDINYCGAPITMGPSGVFVIEERKMTAMIGRLSGILTPVIDKMDSRDWTTVAYRLFRFFLPSAAA